MKESYAGCYEKLYRVHWWWRSRRFILLRVIESYVHRDNIDILDVGCGNGLFFSDLARFGTVQGVETDESLITAENPCRDRIHSMPLGHPAYRGLSFDLITALDVMEHIDDDSEAVAQLCNMLRPDGILILMVPALMCLWDSHDELNRHYRRYNASDLRDLVKHHGDILDLRYLYHWLVPLKLAFKGINRLAGGKLPQHAIPPPHVNKLLTLLCQWEYRVLRSLCLPFGSSLLAVVRKAHNRQ